MNIGRSIFITIFVILLLGMMFSSIGCWPCSSRYWPFSSDDSLADLVKDYDVVIMKHCYPASDILEDTGDPDPSSSRQSIENYKAVYRLLRDEFDNNPDTLFIVWTLPPRHQLDGDSDEAARATEFSEWLKTEWLEEDGGTHSNIYVWDFREIVMDPETNFLKYEYERDHSEGDSHPNSAANNVAGPLFAQFIVDSIEESDVVGDDAEIIFLHHSTGGNVYDYPALGVSDWLDEHNSANGTDLDISEEWYPSDGNMPVHYYDVWLAD